MCTKFGENLSSGLGDIALTICPVFKVIRGHNSGNTCKTKFQSLYANLHINKSMCIKFGENVYKVW